MHKVARTILVERSMERLYLMRAAQAEPEGYSNVLSHLQGQLEDMRPHAPITPEQAAKNRRDFARHLGLRPKRR